MKCCFSIDALADSGAKAWRLLADREHWRAVKFAEPLQAGDLQFAEGEDAAAWHGLRLRDDKDGLRLHDRPGRFDFLIRGIFSHAVLHRCSAAPIPDLQQMCEVVAAHDAGTPWLLYVNIGGQFAMLDTRCEPLIGNLRIAVRGEIASSPAYVGAQAAIDDVLMQRIYHQFIAAWSEHLKTSRMGLFVPDVESLRSLQEYRAYIDEWQAEDDVE